MKISKELLSEVLGDDVRIGTYIKADVDVDEPVQYTMQIKIYGNKVSYWRYYKEWDDGTTMVICSVNIYELAHKNLKQWAKLKNVFDIIDWSGEPEQILSKAEEIRKVNEKQL